MVLVIAVTVFNPLKTKQGADEYERMGRKHQLLGVFVFFFVGIYGGFIQAGVGFIMIAALTTINGFSLVKTNSAKVFVVLTYTLAAIVVFILEDKIDWTYGSVNKGDKWIKRVLLVTVFAMAIRLWFF